ncbi:MAG: hypothetical protein A2W91_03280 [Bacteroidetes bacterium GWF2_38_335]|nr:MAG: hypothetical protein A2W91_03280 [Bacteroidetes bacterium GWF2_38_335]OFY77490.1 MAG: hypothetical protein A2281_01480 [Bacteroidetes bacterium RIFOXYA12_FULL_38_20]HBS87217.1 hypothetical protein [Bacteroidales bacterium]
MKTENLVIGLLGKVGAGKSHTWSALFGRNVKTGKNLRKLFLNENEYVEVFLINVAPRVRHKYVGEIITVEKPRIILCSIDYSPGVEKTVDYFIKSNYSIYVHWLNPGYNDAYDPQLFYTLGIINHLLQNHAVVGIRNAKGSPDDRVTEIKNYIYGWAKSQGLLKNKNAALPEKDKD